MNDDGDITALRESANPYVWFRALVMDLGFAGLIEEIEKRFGKTATTFLLGMLFLAVILWAFKLVMALFVEIDTLSKSRDVGDLLLAMAYRLGFLLFATSLVIAWARTWLKKVETRFDEKARRVREELNERSNAIEADIVADRKIRSEVDELLDKMEAKGKELTEQLSKLEQLADETCMQNGERRENR